LPVEQKTYVELQNGGLFSKFDWMPDPYDNFLESQKSEQKNSRMETQAVHPHPLKVGTYKPPPKHQSLFSSKTDEMSQFFSSNDDPYEASKYEVLRAKWLADSKILYGDFKPASSNKSL